MRAILSNLKNIHKLMQIADVKLSALMLISSIGFVAVLFDFASIALLVPIIRSMIAGNFEFLEQGGLIARRLFDWLPTDPFRAFILLAAMVAVLTVARELVTYIQNTLTIKASSTFIHRLRYRAYAKLMEFEKEYFDDFHSGRVYKIIINQTSRIASSVIGVAPGMVRMCLTAVVYSGFMLYLSPHLFAVVLAFAPIYVAVTGVIFKLLSKASASAAKEYRETHEAISNRIHCIPLVKANALENEESRLFEVKSEKLRSHEANRQTKSALLTPLHELIELMLVFLLLACAHSLLMKQHAGQVTSYLIFFFVLRRWSAVIRSYVESVAKIQAVTPDVNEVLHMFDDKGKGVFADGFRNFECMTEGIEFKNLNFSYPHRRNVLKNISFTIPKGTSAALVGPTGSGKTTLISLLLRLYDIKPNEILIDGTDIRDYRKESLRRNIAYVSQECYLFNDTIYSNVSYGCGRGVSESQIYEALRVAGLDTFVLKLPDRLQTRIGERGIKLSGGERQRLSIARAVLKNAQILIIDEGTSSVDSITERRIQEALVDIIRHKTSIIAAHRFSTIMNADNVIVLDDGVVIETGAPSELIASENKFYELWKYQISG